MVSIIIIIIFIFSSFSLVKVWSQFGHGQFITYNTPRKENQNRNIIIIMLPQKKKLDTENSLPPSLSLSPGAWRTSIEDLDLSLVVGNPDVDVNIQCEL